MCGRYRLRSDKQRIADAFAVGGGLEDIYFEPGEDIAPDSVQPVVLLNEDGDRQIELMRWGVSDSKEALVQRSIGRNYADGFLEGVVRKKALHRSCRCDLRVAGREEREKAEIRVCPSWSTAVWHGGGLEALEEP
jgi:hypothetical protein